MTRSSDLPSESVRLELKTILTAFRQRERTIPLLDVHYAASDVEFRPLSAELLGIISASPNYVEIVPGEGPTWIKFFAHDKLFELVLYRALGDDVFYVLGPDVTLQ